MSYFDIYKKRLNSKGTTSQERIQSTKEKSFSQFLNKSIYKKFCNFGEETFIVSLQPNKEYESKCICTLLTEKSLTFPVGALLEIFEKEKGPISRWIIIHLDKYTKDGYNRYKVIEANRQISWFSNKIEYSSYVYLSGQMDKVVDDLFKTTGGVDMYREPEKTLKIIIPTNLNFKKDTYLEIDDEAWKVEEFDKISVPGISYALLKETLVRGEDPFETPTKPDAPSDNSFWTGGI